MLGACLHVVEVNSFMSRAYQGLRPLPSRLGMLCDIPRHVYQLAHFTVPRAEEKLQDFVGQFLDRNLSCILLHRVRLSAVCDHEIGGQRRAARGQNQSAAHIPEVVDISLHRHMGFGV